MSRRLRAGVKGCRKKTVVFLVQLAQQGQITAVSLQDNVLKLIILLTFSGVTVLLKKKTVFVNLLLQ